MNEKLSIYLVDDHTLFREGIRFLLSKCPFVSEIHEAGNGKELLENIHDIQPDIVLMDIQMPEMNGIDATRAVMQLLPETKIIALSMYANECFYSDMIKAGAKGFLLKHSRFEDVQRAIKEVHNGRSYFSPEILEAILSNLNNPSASSTPQRSNPVQLTNREIEVLFNICRGLSNQEIGELLNISKRTVDKHRENILLKTQSKNTAELVVFAIKNGFFELQ